MIGYIIIGISLIIDGVLTNFLPYSVSALSLFTPLTTLVSLIIVYPLYYHRNKEYYILAFVLGIIYDLFYTNLLFLNGFLFLLIALLYVKLYKEIGDGVIRILISILLCIVIYELLTAGIILIFNLVPLTFSKVLYKIDHSLLLNLIYGEILFLITKLLPKKYYKAHIN